MRSLLYAVLLLLFALADVSSFMLNSKSVYSPQRGLIGYRASSRLFLKSSRRTLKFGSYRMQQNPETAQQLIGEVRAFDAFIGL